MAKFWFENSQGERRVIAECDTMEECEKAINKFINDHNKGRPKNKKFVSYYTRTWEENGETVFDVGSHSEFFYLSKVFNNL